MGTKRGFSDSLWTTQKQVGDHSAVGHQEPAAPRIRSRRQQKVDGDESRWGRSVDSQIPCEVDGDEAWILRFPVDNATAALCKIDGDEAWILRFPVDNATAARAAAATAAKNQQRLACAQDGSGNGSRELGQFGENRSRFTMEARFLTSMTSAVAAPILPDLQTCLQQTPEAPEDVEIARRLFRALYRWTQGAHASPLNRPGTVDLTSGCAGRRASTSRLGLENSVSETYKPALLAQD